MRVNIKKDQLSIPLDQITKVKIKNGLFGRTVIDLEMEDAKLKLSLVKNTIGSKLTGQKEGVELLKQSLSR